MTYNLSIDDDLRNSPFEFHSITFIGSECVMILNSLNGIVKLCVTTNTAAHSKSDHQQCLVIGLYRELPIMPSSARLLSAI